MNFIQRILKKSLPPRVVMKPYMVQRYFEHGFTVFNGENFSPGLYKILITPDTGKWILIVKIK